MKQIWAQRVAVFEYIFSCLISEESDPNVIINNFKTYDKYNRLNDWQLKIIENFAYSLNDYHNLIKDNLKSKWSYEEFDNVSKAIIMEAISEWNTYKTDKAILIDQSLITINKYADKHLKKIVNAILDKILV
ncbi:DUF1948 domain-containing protein [Mycoplasmoides pirum]|uniref:DUF1948 domain-containing protein n=1 Tax=Mycoplasmoides pirum TaxID=2122 RepID=UPI000487A342|nr:DUF1948 domain-containing protein [Mycoplasmoides pirum]